MKQLAVLSVVCVLLIAPATVLADSAAVSFTSFPGAGTGDLNIGWSFQVNTAVSVTGLGYFDYQSDGLASEHTVGIFELSNLTPLVTGVVGSGVTGTLLDGFRYTSITPFLLNPGTTYFLMANNPDTDPFVGFVGGFAVDPRITYGTGVFAFGGATLQHPSQIAGVDPSVFGPNMLISDPIPEPSTVILLGTGLLGVGIQAMRRRRNAARNRN